MAAVENYPRTAYDSLVKMKETHIENVRTLKKAIENKSQDKVRLEDISKYRDRLLELKHSGPQLSRMLDVTKQVQQKNFQHWERKLDLSEKVGPLASSKKPTQCFST